MLNLFKASLVGLVVCMLVVGMFGCRKKSGESDLDGVPGEPIEIEDVADVVIDEGEWMAPDAVDAETAGIYKTVYFGLNKSDIREDARPVLEAIADDLRSNKGRYLRAVGHCCELDTNEYNFALGERRAKSVRAYLVALGVDAGRIRTLSMGEEEPADPGHDEAALRKNRRVEFLVADR